MNLKLLRYSTTANSTLGLLYLNDRFECYTLENPMRETLNDDRIPNGTFKIAYRREMTDLTKKYRERYKFFRYHIELLNVPNRSWIYIHAGNDEEDTLGCILVGDMANNNTQVSGFIGDSRKAYERLYTKASFALDNSEPSDIQILDL